MKKIARYAAMAGMYVLVTGCATDKTRKAAPLYPTAPSVEAPAALQKMPMPAKPNTDPVQLKLVLQQTHPQVGADNSVLRRGVTVDEDASVVISVPKKDDSRTEAAEENGKTSFRTAENFDILEQFVEKGLLMSGFHVKDRSKFEAKLRDLRDTDAKHWWGRTSVDSDLGQLKGELDKQLTAGSISMDEYTEQLVGAREQLSDKRYGKNRDKNEVSDISELIRAAQDGEVQADYILQVNNMWVDFIPSARQVNIKQFDETSKFLAENPGLQVSGTERKDALPANIEQRWMMAAFNGKLINVKTGSIDWIGEYSIDSLSVLEAGIQVMIDARKQTVNDEVIQKEIDAFNASLRRAHDELQNAYQTLVGLTHEAAAPISYYGKPDAAETHRQKLQGRLDEARADYNQQKATFEKLQKTKSYVVTSEWVLSYLVDPPEVVPDLSVNASRESPERLMGHFRKLGSKVTIDLISSISAPR
jgi:hypothetical protein